MRYGSAADAPTHLGSKDLGLPPEWLPEEAGEIVTSAKRELAARALLQAPPTHLSFAHREAQRVRQPAPVAARPPTERSHPVSPRVSTERSEAPDEVPSVHVSREDRSRMEKAASRVVGTPSRGSSVVVAPPVREPAPLPVAVALPRREDKSAERRARSSAGGDAKSIDGIALQGVGTGRQVTGRVVRFASLASAIVVGAGDVVVTRAVTPALAVIVVGCAAIVSETGGLLDHGAALARELGIPCVVGCHDAWSLLSDGMLVTVDGAAGRVTR